MYFGKLASLFTEIYMRQAYAEAIELLDSAAPQLPAHAAKIMGWKAAVLSLAGDTTGAISILRAALDAGYWYQDEALSRDADFAALHDLPEFQAICAECRSRYEAALAETQPQLTVLEPPVPPPWPLLITLHGNMSHMQEYAPHWTRAAAQGWLVAVPQSTQLTWAGGFYVWDDYERALAEVRQHYTDLCSQYEIDPARLVLAGYSMGGEVAQRIALTRALPARGFIGVEGFIFDLEQIPPLLAARQNPDLRSYLITGRHAEFFEPTRQINAMLRAEGYASQREEMDNEYHGYGSAFEEILGRGLAFVTGQAS